MEDAHSRVKIRGQVVDEAGSVYFRGAETLKVTRDARWQDRQSYYTEHGDWFLPVCLVLAGLAYYVVLLLRPPAPKPEGETVF